MKKITEPFIPEEEEYIFTEGVNYFDLDSESIWGPGDLDTIKFLKKANISGTWLNLAAGDGRYNLDLLKKADTVIATDIDRGALSKLWHITPQKLRSKLKIKVFNILNRSPFSANSLDGIFCTGTLHYFPENQLAKILQEIKRVLKPGGQIILDFATDIKRILPNGESVIKKGTPQYELKEAKKMLKSLLEGFDVKFIELSVPEELVHKPGLTYKFSCKGWLLDAIKK